MNYTRINEAHSDFKQKLNHKFSAAMNFVLRYKH